MESGKQNLSHKLMITYNQNSFMMQVILNIHTSDIIKYQILIVMLSNIHNSAEKKLRTDKIWN